MIDSTINLETIQKTNQYLNQYVKGQTFYKFASKCKIHITDIFNDYWDLFLETYPHLNIRDVVFKEVDKVRKCRTIALGYTMYTCPVCNQYTIVPHTCKSRFCSSCGVQYAKDRTLEASKRCMKTKHRHLTFTIPEELRPYFQNDRTMLEFLFSAVNETITYVFTKMNKTQRITPGFISVLHTYGRDLKWNPHIHTLITEGGITKKSKTFRKITHFHYELYRKTFQRILLDKMYQHLGKSFYRMKTKMYYTHNNGFYVRAPELQFKSMEDGIRYIVRYTGKPVMAESRIIKLENDYITYWYQDHKTGKRVEVTEHVFQFIAKIIKHIPNENFKMVRYYGIYAAKNHQFRPFFQRIFRNERIQQLKNQRLWRYSLMSTFHVDPLRCECGAVMMKEYSYFPYGKNGESYREKYWKRPKKELSNWEHFTGYQPAH